MSPAVTNGKAKKTASKKRTKCRRKRKTSKATLPNAADIKDAELAQVKLEQQVVDLRVQGHSFRAIAEQCEISAATAFRIIERCLVATKDDTFAGVDAIRHEREVEAARIELVLTRLVKLAGLDKPHPPDNIMPDGFLSAVDRIARYSDKLVALRGLKRPPNEIITHGGTENPMTAAIRQWPPEAVNRVLAIFVQQQASVLERNKNGDTEAIAGNKGGGSARNVPSVPYRGPGDRRVIPPVAQRQPV